MKIFACCLSLLKDCIHFTVHLQCVFPSSLSSPLAQLLPISSPIKNLAPIFRSTLTPLIICC